MIPDRVVNIALLLLLFSALGSYAFFSRRVRPSQNPDVSVHVRPVEISSGEQFQRIVQESPVPVLVDFWATWCPPCRLQSPILDQLARESACQIKVAKVDVDANGEWVNQLGIESLPTLMVFDNGKMTQRMVGLQRLNSLRQALKLRPDVISPNGRFVDVQSMDALQALIVSSRLPLVIAVADSSRDKHEPAWPEQDLVKLTDRFQCRALVVRFLTEFQATGTTSARPVFAVEKPTLIVYRDGREIGRYGAIQELPPPETLLKTG